MLSRLLSGSLVFDVIESVDSSVVLSERPGARSIRQRVFGRNRPAKQPETSDEEH